VNVLTDPLPDEGLLCVEASAGTGKTHLLSTLAVRWVVEREDVRIADLLVVTYTVAAAAELRARIRERLAEVRDRLSGGVVLGGDAYLEALARSGDAPGALERAQRALAEFDTASISTIHGFAAAWLGDERGGVGPSEERRRQAVADVLAASAFDPSSALFDVASLNDEAFDRVVRLVLDNPDLALTPREVAEADAGALSCSRLAGDATASAPTPTS
jgi:superfamily I DNA/RNA helicase